MSMEVNIDYYALLNLLKNRFTVGGSQKATGSTRALDTLTPDRGQSESESLKSV